MLTKAISELVGMAAQGLHIVSRLEEGDSGGKGAGFRRSVACLKVKFQIEN